MEKQFFVGWTRTGVIALAMTMGVGCAQAAEPIVAAAADLKFALDEVAQAFKKDTGQSVKRTFDSSGTFAMAHRSRCICQPMRTTYSSFRPKGGPAIRACCTPSAASLTQLRPAS